jgi:hypothetical protein
MSDNDHPELVHLKEALLQARQRVDWISRNAFDRAALRAAEDLYQEAKAALDAYKRQSGATRSCKGQ